MSWLDDALGNIGKVADIYSGVKETEINEDKDAICPVSKLG